MKIYSAGQGGCYPQRPKAEVYNTLRDPQNYSYPKKSRIQKMIALLLLQNTFKLLKEKMSSLFITQPHPQVFSIGQRFNNLQQPAFLTPF